MNWFSLGNDSRLRARGGNETMTAKALLIMSLTAAACLFLIAFPGFVTDEDQVIVRGTALAALAAPVVFSSLLLVGRAQAARYNRKVRRVTTRRCRERTCVT